MATMHDIRSSGNAPLAPLDLDAMVHAPTVSAPGASAPAGRSLEEEYFSGRFPTNPVDPETGQRVRMDRTTPAYAKAWADWMARRRKKPGA